MHYNNNRGDNMEEKVLEIISGQNKAITYEEIFNRLEEDEQPELTKALNKLEKNLKIRITNKGKYEPFNDKTIKLGTLVANSRGFGFVIVENDKDYFIPPTKLNGAINGDVVVIKVVNEEKTEAEIIGINERNLNDLLVGEFYIKDNRNFIKLDDDRLNIIVEIKDNNLGAMPGHKVIIKVENKISNTNYYEGEIVRILGHKNDPGVDILSIAARFQIKDEFSQDVMEETAKLPNEVTNINGRRDLRDMEIFTIDGDDTKDIDDAISLRILDNGHYELGVHIADVSYYVKENTAIGDEALSRGTSVYLADRVIPMLPHKLSNGICSLNPNVDRLAISCVMEIDEKGKTITSEIFESVINSKIQMTYKKVNQILEKNIIPEGYEPYEKTLKNMAELAKIVRKMKLDRGYIDFNVDEPKIIVDEKGKAIDIVKRERGVGENLIEDFMILANEAVATTIFYMKLPFIYRIHGAPNEEKINEFLKFLNQLGYKVNAKIKDIKPLTVEHILDQLKDKKEYPILSSMMLRTMQKAVYDTNNIGHFGLASRNYTHFTSPIRRFPDLTVHRLLRKYLFESQMGYELIDYYERTLPGVAKHSSEREKASVDCERAVNDMKMAEYMMDHIGEEFTGMIDTVTNYGMYVMLPNLVEGLVRLEDIGDDYYYYDETTFSIVGRKSKKRYRLGDNVKVVATEAIKEKGQINFKLANENAKEEKHGNPKQAG